MFLSPFLVVNALTERSHCPPIKSLLILKKHSPIGLCFICLATSYSRRGKPPTTIGAKELNDRVRHGNGCDLFAIATRLFDYR